jgi:hypothetical protein
VLAGLCCGLVLGACGGSKGAATTANSSTSAAGATNSGGTAGQAASSHVVSAHVVTAASGAVSATMTAAGHSPRVDAPWPVSFVVERSGGPARAEVRYEYLFGGQVVAHRSRYSFTGSFHDTFRWPASAVGYPLTFRAVIRSTGVTLNLDYPVQVVR